MASIPVPTITTPALPVDPLQAFFSKLRSDLAQQVSSGGITQAQMDAQLLAEAQKRGVSQDVAFGSTPQETLTNAQRNLANQVASGGINQAQMDNELARLRTELGLKDPAVQTQARSDLLIALAGGDERVAAALASGLGLAEEFFPEGSLGRLQVGPTSDVREALELRRSMLGGFTDAEINALEDASRTGFGQQAQSISRLAKDADITANRRGAITGAVLPELARFTQDSERGLQRDIFLSNIAERNQRLGGFENLANQIQQLQLGQNTFNLGQAEKEKAGQLGLIFGSGQFGSAQSGRLTAEEIAREQIASAERVGLANAGGGFNIHGNDPNGFRPPNLGGSTGGGVGSEQKDPQFGLPVTLDTDQDGNPDYELTPQGTYAPINQRATKQFTRQPALQQSASQFGFGPQTGASTFGRTEPSPLASWTPFRPISF